MKLDRSKNTARNLIFGTVAKIYNLAIPFVMRTLLIYTLGMAYTGLNSLFTSILSVLNLAELGVGSAMTFSMYKPIAEDDTPTVCALMRLYKIYYRIIGLVILVVGAVITPALPFFVKKDVPADINIYVLYAINLLTTVLSYWLFAYKNCILYAHQRNDIGDKIGLVISTVRYGMQAVVLVVFKNYYAYIMVALLLGIVSNIVTAIVVDKLYPQYKAKGELPKEQVQIINRRVRDLFTAKIGAIVVDSADTIVISAFLGLTFCVWLRVSYYGFRPCRNRQQPSDGKQRKEFQRFEKIRLHNFMDIKLLRVLSRVHVSAVYRTLGQERESSLIWHGYTVLRLLLC